MTVDRADELARAPLTYPTPGCSLLPEVAGWQLSRVLGRGPDLLDRAASALFTWRVHLGAGLRVAAPADRVGVDVVVDLSLGLGPLALRAPCRVVAVIDEPDRRGFAYGTLPGHPERGEEAFLLEVGAEGLVTFRVIAVSEPATTVARFGGPVTRAVQRAIVRRYLAAL
jgi:uncharacterized protein (UPF0548 family)